MGAAFDVFFRYLFLESLSAWGLVQLIRNIPTLFRDERAEWTDPREECGRR